MNLFILLLFDNKRHVNIYFPLVLPNRYEDICPSTHNMDVPLVKREDYQLTDISDDGFLTLMSDNGEIREDLKLPEGELGNTLRADFDNGKDLLVDICCIINSLGNMFFPLK